MTAWPKQAGKCSMYVSAENIGKKKPFALLFDNTGLVEQSWERIKQA